MAMLYDHPFFATAPAFAALAHTDEPQPVHVRACLLELARYVLGRLDGRPDRQPRIGPPYPGDEIDRAKLVDEVVGPLIESMREELSKIDVSEFKKPTTGT